MKVNALQIRQTFGKVLKMLQASDEPIIVEKAREPVAVLISLKVFQERFMDYREKEKRDALLQEFSDAAATPKENTLTVLRELRHGSRY